MSTNRQRRDAAKRKLHRRIERAVEQQRKRQKIKKYTALSTAGAVAIAIIAGGSYYWYQHSHNTVTSAESSTTIRCVYPPEEKLPNKLARSGTAPSGEQPRQGIVHAVFETNNGEIPVTLNRTFAPCSVASFAGLISQKFFNNTKCHREVNEKGLTILQCGDPTATGMGGSGFSNPQEKASFLKDDPKNSGYKNYARGYVALAGANSYQGVIPSGSQFFFVIQDSTLPADYPVIGTISPSGLKVLDRILTQGIIKNPHNPGSHDGAPAKEVKITSAKIIHQK